MILRKALWMLLALLLSIPLYLAVPKETYAAYSWVPKADMLKERIVFSAAAVDKKIYVFGGVDNTQSVISQYDVYDTQTNTWTSLGNMPVALARSSAVSLNGKIYISGGSTASNTTSTEFYEYDPVTNTFTTKASPIYDRYDAGMVVLNGKIYLISGLVNELVSYKCEVYDPATNTWTEIAETPNAKRYVPTAVANGKIYVIGGMLAGASNTIEIYDPLINTWTTAINESTIYLHDTTAINNVIYRTGATANPAETRSYDPINNSWTHVANLNTGRFLLKTVAVGGKLYALGGQSGSLYVKTVEELTLFESIESPQNLTATPGNAQVSLNWSAVTGATGYHVKRSTTAGGPYTTIASNVTGTTYTDTTVTNGTTYYYVVTAVDANGESAASNEASATPQGTGTPPPTGSGSNALLVITLVSGLEKEYDLPMSEVNSFIAWYNNRAAGSGQEVYTISKSFNKANFLSRKDYIAFSKIETFEVSEYTPEP